MHAILGAVAPCHEKDNYSVRQIEANRPKWNASQAHQAKAEGIQDAYQANQAQQPQQAQQARQTSIIKQARKLSIESWNLRNFKLIGADGRWRSGSYKYKCMCAYIYIYIYMYIYV